MTIFRGRRVNRGGGGIPPTFRNGKVVWPDGVVGNGPLFDDQGDSDGLPKEVNNTRNPEENYVDLPQPTGDVSDEYKKYKKGEED